MDGITIITGINCVGKGEVLRCIQNFFTINSPYIISTFTSLSKEMRRYASCSYEDLAAMQPDERNIIRVSVLKEICKTSRNQPVFLDVHFAYENGEMPDYSILKKETKQVISILSTPEIVYRRLLMQKSCDHPGRLFMFNNGIPFIEGYQRQDNVAARLFVNEADCAYLEIWNNFDTLIGLRDEVEKKYPLILENIGLHKQTIEGLPSYLETR